MRALRGRVFVEEPEDADLESVRLRGSGFGSGGNCNGFLMLGGETLGIRRDVRPPPGRYIFRGAVS